MGKWKEVDQNKLPAKNEFPIILVINVFNPKYKTVSNLFYLITNINDDNEMIDQYGNAVSDYNFEDYNYYISLPKLPKELING